MRAAGPCPVGDTNASLTSKLLEKSNPLHLNLTNTMAANTNVLRLNAAVQQMEELQSAFETYKADSEVKIKVLRALIKEDAGKQAELEERVEFLESLLGVEEESSDPAPAGGLQTPIEGSSQEHRPLQEGASNEGPTEQVPMKIDDEDVTIAIQISEEAKKSKPIKVRT